MPDRPDCVNDESSWQTISARNFSFTWATTAQRAAFGEQFGASRAMNRSIHSPSAQKGRVSGIHNGVDMEFRDVAAERFNSSMIFHDRFSSQSRRTNAE